MSIWQKALLAFVAALLLVIGHIVNSFFDPDDVVIAQLAVAAVAVNIYPLIYMTRPWYSTAPGRALMVKAWGNLIVIDLSLAYVWLGEYPGRADVRFAGFALFAIGVWYLLLSLLRVVRDEERELSESIDARNKENK